MTPAGTLAVCMASDQSLLENDYEALRESNSPRRPTATNLHLPADQGAGKTAKRGSGWSKVKIRTSTLPDAPAIAEFQREHGRNVRSALDMSEFDSHDLRDTMGSSVGDLEVTEAIRQHLQSQLGSRPETEVRPLTMKEVHAVIVM